MAMMAVAMAMAGGWVTVAVAQDAARVEITGSRIKTVETEAVSPIVTLGAEAIRVEGVRDVESLLNNLPQVFADQGGQALQRAFAQILGQFDLVAMVELRNDLGDLGRVLTYLGRSWDVVYSDWMDDAGRNGERVAYLYDRRAVVFTHPVRADCCRNLIPGVGENVLELATDTARTITSLLVSGTPARCPNVRFIFSHARGTRVGGVG